MRKNRDAVIDVNKHYNIVMAFIDGDYVQKPLSQLNKGDVFYVQNDEEIGHMLYMFDSIDMKDVIVCHCKIIGVALE